MVCFFLKVLLEMPAVNLVLFILMFLIKAYTNTVGFVFMTVIFLKFLFQARLGIKIVRLARGLAGLPRRLLTKLGSDEVTAFTGAVSCIGATSVVPMR